MVHTRPVPLTGTSFLLGLESDLRVRLHGQHLASKLVLRAVKGYLELPHAGKALALSFHGWSGTGKNFVARMVVDNLYRDGMRSDCVRMFISTFHFPHPKQLDAYKVRLGVVVVVGPSLAWQRGGPCAERRS